MDEWLVSDCQSRKYQEFQIIKQQTSILVVTRIDAYNKELRECNWFHL